MNNNLLTHDELKLALCSILKDFADFCDRNDLKYVLCCGTLLGAVRHKGMIPWDDDIDVSMPRNDYERLNELLKEDTIKPYYNPESLAIGNSPFPFLKLFDSRYEVVGAESELNKNIWIDVFPVDGFPDNYVNDYSAFSAKIFNYCRLLAKSCKPVKFYGLSKFGLKQTVSVLISHFHSSYYYGNKLDEKSKLHTMTECEYSASICWNGVRGFLKSSRYFEDRVKVEFEGNEYYAPNDWDEYLTKFYGDYMKIPDEKERETHNVNAKKVEL